MRKKEILIVAGILLLAVVSLAAYRLLGRGKTATGKINVYVNGALYAPAPRTNPDRDAAGRQHQCDPHDGGRLLYGILHLP